MLFSLLFDVFMADYFGSCVVGDVRASLLRIVTPPASGDLEIIGSPIPDPSFFAVRKIMDVKMRAEAEESPLYSIFGTFRLRPFVSRCEPTPTGESNQ
jgi:hypothetical protein